MSVECSSPIGLVFAERRWPKALAALVRYLRSGTRFRNRVLSEEVKP